MKTTTTNLDRQIHIMNGIAFTAIVLLLTIAMVILFGLGDAHAATIGGPAAPAQPAATTPSVPDDEDQSRLAADFAAATAMACAATSATNPAPIDPLACTCNQFITAALPSLKLNDGEVKGVVSAAERLRVIKIRAGQSTFKTQFQAACGGLLMSIRDDALSLAGFIRLIK